VICSAVVTLVVTLVVTDMREQRGVWRNAEPNAIWRNAMKGVCSRSQTQYSHNIEYCMIIMMIIIDYMM